MAKKEKKIRTKFEGDNYKLALKLVRSSGMPHVIKRSNYTLDIESPFLSIYFYTNAMSKHPFIISKMIQKNALENKIEPVQIDKRQLKYFAFNELKILKGVDGQIYNIDLTSAYATVLKNKGIIDDRTSNYLNSISKPDRLASLGILAGTKDVFTYDGINKAPIETTEKKESEWLFYLCVLEVQNLMMELKSIIGKDFLFYWVDSIFFTGIENREIIQQYLNEKNYPSTFEVCHLFKLWEENKVKYLSYWKEGLTKSDYKILNMPSLDKEVKDFVIKFCRLLNE
jgi:hypothetical protein